MSESTFTIRPLTQAELEHIEKHYQKYPSKPHATFICSYCDARIHHSKYSDHVSKLHNWDSGRIYRPTPKTKVNATLLFAELQQSDATDRTEGAL